MSKITWNTASCIEIDSAKGLAGKLLSSRGLGEAEIADFLQPDYKLSLGKPETIHGIKAAAARIEQALRKSQSIAIYGDYDIDGMTASALLYDFLSALGNTPLLYIPDRFEEGYGLNSEALKKLKKQQVDLVISVDCGVTAHQQAELCKKVGLDLIITDHHEPDGDPPKGALACVNPKFDKDDYFKNLSGVGVAFCLALVLQKKLKKPESGLEKWLLDLVALGTVCDVVPLVGINRALVRYGLIVMQKSRRPGLKALADAAGVDLAKINESDLGFKIGPRLNAAGRLTHAQKALDILVSKEYDQAKLLSAELNELNYQRQQATKTIFEEANKQARQYRAEPILVLHSDSWSHGVVGIVASRIAEKWRKPVLLLQEMGESSKGSARSYGSFNIIEAIRDCSEILKTFGGHAFAAGLTIETERIKELRYRINQYAINNMSVDNNLKVLDVSIKPKASANSLGLVEEIGYLAPFGNQNPRPKLMSEFIVDSMKLVGSDASHLRLILSDDLGITHDAIGFGMATNYPWLEPGLKIEVAYEVTENVWNNVRKHQIELLDIRQTNN